MFDIYHTFGGFSYIFSIIQHRTTHFYIFRTVLWMWVLGAMKGSVWLTTFVNANRHFLTYVSTCSPKYNLQSR